MLENSGGDEDRLEKLLRKRKLTKKEKNTALALLENIRIISTILTDSYNKFEMLKELINGSPDVPCDLWPSPAAVLVKQVLANRGKI